MMRRGLADYLEVDGRQRGRGKNTINGLKKKKSFLATFKNRSDQIVKKDA